MKTADPAAARPSGRTHQGRVPVQAPKKPPVDFGERDRQLKFLEHIRTYGTKYHAAAAAGVSYEQVRQFTKVNPDFAAELEQAQQDFIDMLEQAAMQRAVHGVKRPIIGGKDRDQVVAHENVYSDSLMSLLLKRHRPDAFRENVKIDATVRQAVLVVPAKITDIHAWYEAEQARIAAEQKIINQQPKKK